MASIRKREGSRVAEVRRTGHKSVSRGFPTKSLACEWARKVEARWTLVSTATIEASILLHSAISLTVTPRKEGNPAVRQE